jgi:hypothetical protein
VLIISNPTDLPRIANPAIRQLVALRFQQLAPSASPATPGMSPDGYFVLVAGGDAVSEIEHAVGFPILTGLFDDLPYTDPDFQSCAEIFEEHRNENGCIYEMVFIGNDDGTFACLIIPDEQGVNSDLLALCHAFATTASGPAMSTP